MLYLRVIVTFFRVQEHWYKENDRVYGALQKEQQPQSSTLPISPLDSMIVQNITYFAREEIVTEKRSNQVK